MAAEGVWARSSFGWSKQGRSSFEVVSRSCGARPLHMLVQGTLQETSDFLVFFHQLHSIFRRLVRQSAHRTLLMEQSRRCDSFKPLNA